jgi:hypothetical protein
MNSYLARVAQAVLAPSRMRPIAAQRFTSRFSPETTLPGIVSDLDAPASPKGSEAPDLGASESSSLAAASVEASRDGTLAKPAERREPPSQTLTRSPQSAPARADDSSAQFVPEFARPQLNITVDAPRTDIPRAPQSSSALVAPQHAARGVAQQFSPSIETRVPASSDRERPNEQPVHIHIGRIDVRAVTAPAVPPVPAPRRAPGSLLDAHMRARDSGKR